MDRLVDFRRVFAQVVTTKAGCAQNARLVEAFATVPRHDFVGEGPWIVGEDGERSQWGDPALAYHDMNLGIGPRTPTGLPSLHARCLHACELRAGADVIHIGAGTGYFTAIIAELVGERGRLVAYEIDEMLAARAEENLRPWSCVEVRAVSGADVADEGADLVYVNAGVQRLPLAWLDALAPGGKLVVPLVPGIDEGGVFLITKLSEGEFAARYVCPARFVPCIGAEDEALSARLADAFRRGGFDRVRALTLSPPAANDRVWFAGDGIWLCT